MPFSEQVVKNAFGRAGGKCECIRGLHKHPGDRCRKPLVWEDRGKRNAPGGWDTHHETMTAAGIDRLGNCQILCWDCIKLLPEHHP